MSDTQWVSWALKRFRVEMMFSPAAFFRQLRNCMGRTSAVMPRREPQEVSRQIGRKQTQAKWDQKSHGVAKTYLNLMPF